MTSWNAFEHDGHNGFASCGFNARNGTVEGLPLYVTTHDGNRSRLVKIFAGAIVWAVLLPDSASQAYPDLTINANGVYTANGYSAGNDNIRRWDRDGNLLNSAQVFDSTGKDVAIASNNLGDVFAVGATDVTTKYAADLTVALTGNTDIALDLSLSYSRRIACAPDGDLYVGVAQAGAGGGYARGWRASDLGFYGTGVDPHILGVRESLNPGTSYYGSAPSFLTNGGDDFGMSISSETLATGSFQAGRGKGVDNFTGLLVSDDIAGPRTRGVPSFGRTPVYISTTGDLNSFTPNGTKLERYDEIDAFGSPATPTWSLEIESIFTSLPTGPNIENVAYALLPQRGGARAYVWGASYNTTTNVLDAFVGEMVLATQTESWLLLNSDPLVNGVLGLSTAPLGSDSGFGITAGVIDQPGEGYSDPEIF